MDPNISIISSNGQARLTLELKPAKDIILSGRNEEETPTISTTSTKEPKKLSDTTNIFPPQSSSSATDLLLYPKAAAADEKKQQQPRPFRRYKRRNSAVASTLFQSTTQATASFMRRPAHNVESSSMGLSTALRSMDAAEALLKAKELTDAGAATATTPTRSFHKRASMPWSQKYTPTVVSSADDAMASRKRQRTTGETA